MIYCFLIVYPSNLFDVTFRFKPFQLQINDLQVLTL